MAGALEEPVLVATKLHVPSVRPGFVVRAALVERLVAELGGKLTLVCAPAGWGKTTLLSEWRASPAEPRPFAWLSLDRGDDDPVRFWAYVIAALRTVQPQLGAQSLAQLPRAATSLVDAVVAPLINELAPLEEPLVLVLDDYHLVRSETIHESIAFLLRHLPAPLHVAIASRADPPLALAGLRAAGEITEIRAADLRFTDEEADELLNGSLGLGLEPGDVELLRARTEGWAAGLQLAALSARPLEDRHAYVQSLAGDDRQIGDYLHEVLAEQTPELREFLLRTSILDRLCAPLCDAVTGRNDGSERLEAVDRSNLFLVSLDTRREWYRYHQLFADLLRYELSRAEPELASDLHRRAAAWHRERGNVEDAIAHATAAGDFAGASELIARHWRPVWSGGQRETVARWIDALPREVVLGDARLCLARGWAALYGDLPECDRWRSAAERAPLPAPFRDGSASVEEAVAMLEAAHANLNGDVGRALAAARRALARIEDRSSPAQTIANVHLGMAAYYAGDLAAAEAALEAASRTRVGAEWASVSVTALGNLSAIQLETGDAEQAERTLAETERAMDELHAHDAPFACRAWLARGMLCEHYGDTAGATAAYDQAVRLARAITSRLVTAHGLLQLAALDRRRGAHVEARARVREARRVVEECADPGVVAELLTRAERALQLAPAQRAAGALPARVELSERELTVLRLLGTSLSQREIASELYVSFNTVKSHTRTLFRKLGVATRADAVARARALELL